MSATAQNVVLITSEEDIYRASRALKAIAHPLRLKMLCILGGAQEVSVQDLVKEVGTSQSNISQHLSILRDKDILASRRTPTRCITTRPQDPATDRCHARGLLPITLEGPAGIPAPRSGRAETATGPGEISLTSPGIDYAVRHQ